MSQAPDPASLPPTSGQVLWLMPEEETVQRLSWWIRDLAGSLGGPVFAPHLTLLGGLGTPPREGLELLQRRLSTIAPFRLRTAGVGLQGHPFRALFLPVPMTRPLWRLRRHALRALRDAAVEELPPQEPDDEAFFPHVSLYYGGASADARWSTLTGLPATPECGSNPESRPRLGPSTELSFEVRAVHLVSADGPPEDWHTLASFPLEG